MMDKVFSRDYHPVSKSDADGDRDATVTNRPPRRGIQQSETKPGSNHHHRLAHNPAAPGDCRNHSRRCRTLPQIPSPQVRYWCGNSTKEAEALGCAYDPLAGCWLHKECPHDLTHEFAHFNNGKPFVYFYDVAATQQMKHYTELGNNPDFYWTAVREHLVHCLYLLRRGHDVHMRGDPLDNMLADLEHVDHCINMLANLLRRPDPALEEIGTQGQTHSFMSCA
ncbi:unnamed protein product [Penicillium egyptiacum]|uniref:Uncharacterized protein n=1 Tax=Penicillium egyptiacum TaxID=1303716 RepID=A0A9W4K3E8_9EURO|nr:unnamed protein product [Penicillium egyptiacum]